MVLKSLDLYKFTKKVSPLTTKVYRKTLSFITVFVTLT